MTTRKATKVPAVVRRTLLISDADEDLKLWLWHNQGRSGDIIRLGLRAELIRRGELPAARLPEGTESAGHASPIPADRRSTAANPDRPTVQVAESPAPGPAVAAPFPVSPKPSDAPPSDAVRQFAQLSPDQLAALFAAAGLVAPNGSLVTASAPPEPVDPKASQSLSNLLGMGFD